MRIIIVGAGKTGDTLIEYISSEDHDVCVVDTDPRQIEEAVNRNDIMGIVGNGADADILKEADAEHSDMLIALTASDELNILCCMLAKKLGVKRVIARIRNPMYTQQNAFMRREFGLNMIVDQDYEAALEISRILRFPSAIKLDVFAKGRLELAEFRLEEDNPLVGKRLADVSREYKMKILVCAVEREEEVFIPDGSFECRAGDKVYVTASHRELASFFKEMGIFRKKAKDVMIAGGGGIAYHLAQRLIESGMSVSIIERDEKRCIELSEALHKARIICADATDQAVLNEEGIDKVDAFVSLLDMDEENIILSMYANKKKVEKVITKVSRINIAEMLSAVAIDSIVSPRNTVANQILRYIRARANAAQHSIQTLYKLVNDKAEAIEFVISDGVDTQGLTDITLKDIQLKPNLLIACIIRERDIIYPGGNDVIKPGDTVVVITDSENHIYDIKDILK